MPFNHKVTGTRWVYKAESDFTFKARLVVQGWSQRPGIDCGAAFAPVSHRSQRLLLAISTQHDWDIYMLDVKSAFLQSKIDEEVFVKQAPGYGKLEAATGIPMVMKLEQAVYGLRTASRVWHHTLDKALKTIGFTSTKSDPCLYMYEMGGGVRSIDNLRR